MRKKIAPHLLPEDRLAVLRAADNEREWASLDDPRVCVRCERAITGRQIEISRDERGRYILRCPTDGCASTAHDWIYPTAGSADLHGDPLPVEIEFFDLTPRPAGAG
ncbi:MAG: hypothetical protein M3Z64_09160 [Verrucomicrobiota bacterium]|nr:hypothetical protein [Verrucomicrobiota bacterium]